MGGEAVVTPSGLIRGAAGLVAALILWDLAVRTKVIDPLLLLPPGDVLLQLWRGWTVPSFGESPLLRSSSATVRHFAVGFGLAILIGTACGAILAMATSVRDYGSA